MSHANIKDWAANYDGELFDGILCDPPYELGFMGKSWDNSGIAFDTEMWADLFKLVKPGGHLLAFSGSRTYHRMAVAIEDAGFEIRDMIEWVYGSGFPKSLNIGKAVDKIQGNERKDAGLHERQNYKKGGAGFRQLGEDELKTDYRLTKGNSPYEGYGTALKPAHEPCVLARKPIEGTVANNVLKHGTGGLNIDGTRVQGLSDKELNWTPQRHNEEKRADENVYGGGKGFYPKEEMTMFNPTGRFPANLIHDGSDEVEAVFPHTKSQAGVKNLPTSNIYGGNSLLSSKTVGTGQVTGFTDSGSASRFFYTAKASKSERNAGLEGFEPQITNDGREKDIDNAFQRGTTLRSNHHPTVKPLALTKYLATLIKPPTGGRLLVPFSGSGSEMIGALQAGWEYVEGVELTEEYIPIAEARIAYWVKQPNQEKLL